MKKNLLTSLKLTLVMIIAMCSIVSFVYCRQLAKQLPAAEKAKPFL